MFSFVFTIPEKYLNIRMSIHFPDIDECVTAENPCLFEDFCTNTMGGYSCKCGPGYSSIEDKACLGDTFSQLVAIKSIKRNFTVAMTI